MGTSAERVPSPSVLAAPRSTPGTRQRLESRGGPLDPRRAEDARCAAARRWSQGDVDAVGGSQSDAIPKVAPAEDTNCTVLDPIGLTSSGGRWHVSFFDRASAAAARTELRTSVIGDGAAAPAFTSPRATAVVGTAGNRVLLASETTVWRVGCP